MKVHLDTGARPACGRGGKVRTTTDVSRVSCLVCQGKDVYTNAMLAHRAEQEAAYQAQTPTQVRSIWGDGNYVCQCGGDLWRERPRSLFSFHFVCEACGKSIYPLTETGMCQ